AGTVRPAQRRRPGPGRDSRFPADSGRVGEELHSQGPGNLQPEPYRSRPTSRYFQIHPVAQAQGTWPGKREHALPRLSEPGLKPAELKAGRKPESGGPFGLATALALNVRTGTVT